MHYFAAKSICMFVTALGFIHAPASGQVLPREVLHTVFQYFDQQATQAGYALVITIDRFPDTRLAAVVAKEAGIRAGASSEVVRCNDIARMCDIIEADRLLDIRDYRLTVPGQEIHLLMYVSTEVHIGESIKTFFSLREITVRNENGWRVSADRTVAQS